MEQLKAELGVVFGIFMQRGTNRVYLLYHDGTEIFVKGG